MDLTLKNINKLTLNTFDKVKKFVNIANSFEFGVDVMQGKYIVDGKSVMGMFSLNLTEPVTVVIDTNKLEEIREFNEKIRGFN